MGFLFKNHAKRGGEISGKIGKTVWAGALAGLVFCGAVLGFVPSGAEGSKCENLGAGVQVQIAPRADDEVFYTTSAGVTVKKQNSTLYTTLGGQVYAVLGQGDGTMNSYVGGYTQLEYIENTGTAYFNTGLHVTTNLAFQAKVFINASQSTTYPTLMGCRSKSGVGGFYSHVNSGNLHFATAASGSYPNLFYKTSAGLLGKDVEYDLNKERLILTMDGTSETFSIARAWNNYASPMALFTFYQDGSDTASYMKGKIYYWKFYDNGVLTRDYVPVKCNTCGNFGLLDKVSGKLNEGIGTFVAGPNATAAAEVLNAQVYDNFSYASGALEEDLAFRTVEGFEYVGGVERGYLLCQGQESGDYMKLRI